MKYEVFHCAVFLVFCLFFQQAHGQNRNDYANAFAAALNEAAKQQAELDRQKELIRYQYELEMNRVKIMEEAAYQRRLENERRQQAEAKYQQEENQRKTAVAEAQRIALVEAKKLAAVEEKRLETSTGTGFFVNVNGYVVTNFHVVEEKTIFAIKDLKGNFYKAKLVAKDIRRDLAVLKIDGLFPSLLVGNSDTVSKGQHVLTVGYPQISIQGNESKVTDGLINSFSGFNNDINWFQISVPIQGGNSGGSLVTDTGVVVGVVVATANVAWFYKHTGNMPQNVNYAIKSNTLIDFLRESNIKNIASNKSKTSISGVDQATVLVIARNIPIEVNYTDSPEKRASDERERINIANEVAKRRINDEREEKNKAAQALVDEKKQKALAIIEAIKKQKDDVVAEQKNRAIAVREEKEKKDRLVALKKRDIEIQKSFSTWPAITGDRIFSEWLEQKRDNTEDKLLSLNASDVISVLVLFENEKVWFSELLRKQEIRQEEKRKEKVSEQNEGELCVGPNAKVGDSYGPVNGNTQTIKSLSGSSYRCKAAEHPILARIVTSTSTTFTSKAWINIPNGFVAKSLTDLQKNKGGLLMAINNATDIGLYVSSIKRDVVSDLSVYALQVRTNQATPLDEPQQSEIEQLTINGIAAWRFETKGKIKNILGKQLTYLTTVLEGTNEILILNAWTKTENYDKHPEQLKDLAKNINGL